MNILIACDKFKGSLTASEACEAIREGLLLGLPQRDTIVRCLPIADGGDGIAGALTAASGGEWIEVEVNGPLGDRVMAGYGRIDGGRTAVVEMASASGLALLGHRLNDPLRASTYGTGELIRHAVSAGAESLLLGIGGSATNDGGTGMALALGYRFYDSDGRELSDLPFELERAARLVPPEGFPFSETVVACDVTNLLLGPNGATRIYGPQKGISPGDFALHEARFERLVALAGERGEAAAVQPGSGAAGGLGFGAICFLGARLVPGFALVADRIGLDDAVSWADLVLTGEGRLDQQSLEGKAPFGVVRLAREKGKRTAAFCGSLEDRALEDEFGPIYEIRVPDLSLEENMSRGAERLRIAATALARDLQQTL